MRLTTQQIMLRQIKEDDFQQQIIDLAQRTYWTVAHFRNVRIQRKDGSVHYACPVQADGEGFPDLILLKFPYKGIAAEIKSETGKLTNEQRHWLRLFYFAGFRVAVWRPRDWDKIERILRV